MHLWDDGHFLAQGMQADLRSQKTINHYSSLWFCQPEQGRNQGAFASTGASDDANLQERSENNFNFITINHIQQASVTNPFLTEFVEYVKQLSIKF